MSFFDGINQAPEDPIFGLQTAFNADTREKKVNLSIGIYKNEQLKTPLLTCIQDAEQVLFETPKSRDYLPIDGDKKYLDATGDLIFGELWSKKYNQMAAIQAIGGTGALRCAGDLIRKEIADKIYVPDLTWVNHRSIFTHAGLRVETYPYYDHQHHCVDFQKMHLFFENLPKGSVVLLQAACHNPTGCDPTHEQWRKLSELFLEKQHLVFFDSAYQGFDEGLDQDAFAIRLFAERGHELIVATSYAKNLALYGERAGALFVLTRTPQAATAVKSQIKITVRASYSNPSLHGARLVATLLTSPLLRQKWVHELTQMRNRISKMRTELAERMGWSHIRQGKGLFSLSGFERTQVEKLMVEKGVYLPLDGRINIAGLTKDNIDYIVHAFKSLR